MMCLYFQHLQFIYFNFKLIVEDWRNFVGHCEGTKSLKMTNLIDPIVKNIF